ncbi:hypothetical protein DRQ21_05025 [Candidatus Fermentibacteria bacterium]|nr:MAG: hypothetical protein DRQ21_05025 [Candidatus Fermentibacteria bacterium]
MVRSLELTGSIGYVPANESDGDVFGSILSGGTKGAEYLSATGGYRYTSNGGFIFRAAGGGGYFFNDDDSRFIPLFSLV